LLTELRKKDDFNIQKSFNSVKDQRRELVTSKSLSHFFKRNGCQIKEEQVNAMMKRIDLNGDGSLDFNEFQSFFLLFDKDNKMLLTSNFQTEFVTEHYPSVKDSQYYSLGKENIEEKAY